LMFHVVIPAGGSGTRLWPLSRVGHPKFLLPLTGSTDSLLQNTVARMERLASPERVYVVTGGAHAPTVTRQLPAIPVENILVEPSPRDSCAAIGLAAAVIAERNPQATIGVFPTDHLIVDAKRFEDSVRRAIAGAAEGLLMTIGITPTRPETGYGYLQCGGQLGTGLLRKVEAYAEKPSQETANAYVEAGNYLWNAGMFVFRADVFLGELARQQPAIHAAVQRAAKAWETQARADVLDEIWPNIPKISVDYAVMEGAAAAGLVATVPADFGWYDIGDFDTLGQVLPTDQDGNVVVSPSSGAEPLLRDSQGMVVIPSTGRLIATMGVQDLVVIETDDAVLVCARSRAQEIKSLVDTLAAQGLTDLL
jgi:mannose-1-phosphate guanylyltransferase